MQRFLTGEERGRGIGGGQERVGCKEDKMGRWAMVVGETKSHIISRISCRHWIGVDKLLGGGVGVRSEGTC
ncbi:hypothetical protein GBA52_029004 [Prunus armeniaca]|nr:hypothetical protein GBA52_029004 [Prunus armeniaca]